MSKPITVLERKPVETELVEREYTHEELLELFPDGGESIVNPLVRRCQEYEAEIERNRATLKTQTTLLADMLAELARLSRQVQETM